MCKQELTGDVEQRGVGESGSWEERVNGGAGEALAVVVAGGDHTDTRSANINPVLRLLGRKDWDGENVGSGNGNDDENEDEDDVEEVLEE